MCDTIVIGCDIMKKLNNKGLAISTMLYGVLIIASLIMILTLGLMAFRRRTTNEFNRQIEQELNRAQYGADFDEMCPLK